VLALTAADLAITVTQVGPASYYDTWYRLDGTFTGGTFSVFFEVTRRITGTGVHRQTVINTTLQPEYQGQQSVVTLQ